MPTPSEKVSTPEKTFDPLESELESSLQRLPILQVGDSMSHSKKRKLPDFKEHEVIHLSREEGDSDPEPQGFSGEEEGDEEEEEEEKPIASRRALSRRQMKAREEPKPKQSKVPPQKKPRVSKGKAKAEEPKGVPKRAILEPLIWEEAALEVLSSKFDIQEAIDRIGMQGWFQLEERPSSADLNLVREFYRHMLVVPSPVPEAPSTMISFWWDNDTQYLSLKEFAEVMGLPTGKGLRITQKKNWPSGSTALIKRLFGKQLDKKNLRTHLLSLSARVVHAFIIKNIMPRAEKQDVVTIADGQILDEVLQGELVDTAQIMFYHMQTSKNSTSAPYPFPHIVKRILQYKGLSYEPESEKRFETRFSQRHLELLQKYGNIDYVEEHKPLPTSVPSSSKTFLRAHDPSSDIAQGLSRLEAILKQFAASMEKKMDRLIELQERKLE